jgi:endonuclease/exonuclease/phosphatase family metal-dependent hydrolase
MRPLSIALAVSVAVAVAGVARRPADGARVQAADRLRVATFNIYKGADNNGRYSLPRTIATIAGFDADVVGLQEVMRNHPQFNCDDQPALIADGLTRLTGRRWRYVFERSWITADRECIGRGRGDGVATEGLALLVPEPILASAHIRLAESRVGLMVKTASTHGVPVVVTHLAASRRNQQQRVEQIAQLLPWLASLGPGILMGDLNARPDAIELEPILAHHRDAWIDALAIGANHGVRSGSTRPSFESRIDFVFYDATAPLTVESVEVRNTGSLDDEEELVEASDHRPVIASFRAASVK